MFKKISDLLKNSLFKFSEKFVAGKFFSKITSEG